MFQTLLYRFIHQGLAPDAIHSKPVSNVVENRFRKGIRFLKYHPDAATNIGDVHVQDVFAIEKDLAFYSRVSNRFVHAVHGPEKGRFPAARRPYESGDLISGDVDPDVVKGLKRPVVEVEILDVELASSGILRYLVRHGARKLRFFHDLLSGSCHIISERLLLIPSSLSFSQLR